MTLPAPRITRLSLSNFRSYTQASLDVEASLVVLSGENGAGKTNLLEALSLFAQGKGLRRASYEEMANAGGKGDFSINIHVSDENLGTGVENGVRLTRLNRANASFNDFAEIIRVIWLTPQMDSLFLGAAAERRRFLDRLVLALDSRHGTRVNALERALRSRNKLLEDNAASRWLNAVEHELAELAVGVACARAETLTRLSTHIDEGSSFPHALLALSGFLEERVLETPAIDLENSYRRVLYEGRGRDKAAGRTLEGAHRADLIVTHGPTNALAERCSTGQQKALLIGLILAHAKLITQMAGFAPIILLDEVVAHLDKTRREALFDALEKLNAQVWMSGADPHAFESLNGRAQGVEVREGAIKLQA